MKMGSSGKMAWLVVQPVMQYLPYINIFGDQVID